MYRHSVRDETVVAGIVKALEERRERSRTDDILGQRREIFSDPEPTKSA